MEIYVNTLKKNGAHAAAAMNLLQNVKSILAYSYLK